MPVESSEKARPGTETSSAPTEQPHPEKPSQEPETSCEKETIPTSSPDWERNYRYLLADFDNFRKRVDREKEQAVRSALGRLLLRIVDLHDGIEKTSATLPAEARTVKEGLTMVMKNLEGLMKDERLRPIANPGDEFSPVLHEAVGNLPVTEGAREHTVGHVVQQGYSIDGVVLRPAKVLVYRTEKSKSPSSEESA